MVRAGAVIGLLRSDVDTLADEGAAGRHVRLRDRRRRLRLLAFPRGNSRRTVAPGVYVRSYEKRGSWRLQFRTAQRRHNVALEASLETLRRPLRPCRVQLRGQRLPRRAWRYDHARRVLHVRFRAASTTVIVRRCR